MKELSIEEKAYDGNYKTYTELINRLENVKEAIKKQNYGIAMDILCKPYPEYQITASTELKESEDERMIQYFKDLAPFDKADELYEKYGFSHKDALAWLEKQCRHAKFINGIQVGDKVTRNEDGVLVNLSQLKRVAKKVQKQGEKKSTECSSEQSKTLQTDDVPYESSPNAHLWTRAIGFDGEPMKSKSCEQKSVNTDYISGIRKELLSIEDNAENINGLTESQWVAIRAAHRLLGECIAKEQKPTEWSEEDERFQNVAINILNSSKVYTTSPDKYEDTINWLKSIKDRVQPQPQKEWSEEDEGNVDIIVSRLEVDIEYWESRSKRRVDEDKRVINWLKSLRPNHWKPSDEQMDALRYVANFDYGGHKATLVSLYEQLKKLKG